MRRLLLKTFFVRYRIFLYNSSLGSSISVYKNIISCFVDELFINKYFISLFFLFFLFRYSICLFLYFCKNITTSIKSVASSPRELNNSAVIDICLFVLRINFSTCVQRKSSRTIQSTGHNWFSTLGFALTALRNLVFATVWRMTIKDSVW